MANNEFLAHRVAAGNFTFPTNTAANTASTLSANVEGAYLPKGAIVTGIKLYVGGAMTNISNMKNGTINFVVGTATLGTDDRVASAAMVQTAVKSLAVVAADGFVVPAEGQVVAHIASSDSARTGIVADADVYIDYLYISDMDAS